MTIQTMIPSQVASLTRALAGSPDSVFITDRRNRVIFWNQSMARLLGYAAEEAVGTSCAELMQGCDVHENRYCTENCPVMKMAARGEATHRFHLRLRTKNLSTIHVDVSILHLALEDPDQYLLLHILNLATQPEAEKARKKYLAPPRTTLDAVRKSPDARVRRLTPREVEVLGMLAAGHPASRIGNRLHISTVTARNHVQNILAKLEVHSKTEAVAFAFQKRLFQPDS
jgi:PAS domain S-box-containing protein